MAVDGVRPMQPKLEKNEKNKKQFWLAGHLSGNSSPICIRKAFAILMRLRTEGLRMPASIPAM